MPISLSLVGRPALFLLLAVFLAACSEGTGPNRDRFPDLPSFNGVRDFTDTVTVDDVLRHFWVHLPAAYEHERRRSVPLLIVYHGAGEAGEAMKRTTGLDTLADLHDFAVVYPNAVGGCWVGAGNCAAAESRGVDDIRFTRGLIRRLTENYAIDPDDAYATGFSRGGFFIQFMACREDPPVKAIATLGATMAVNVGALCSLPVLVGPKPIPALLMHGDQDNSVPPGGGGDILSVNQAAAILAQLNQCRGDAIVSFPPLDPSPRSLRIRRSLHDRCADGTRVQIDVVEGGAHMWFGALEPDSPFSASEIVVDFLRAAGL